MQNATFQTGSFCSGLQTGNLYLNGSVYRIDGKKGFDEALVVLEGGVEESAGAWNGQARVKIGSRFDRTGQASWSTLPNPSPTANPSPLLLQSATVQGVDEEGIWLLTPINEMLGINPVREAYQGSGLWMSNVYFVLVRFPNPA